MAKRRNPRVDEAVKQGVARLLKDEIGDPRVRHVTVTDVHVTEDHRHATVYYTTLDPELVSGDPARSGGDELVPRDDVAEGLESAAPRIQGLLKSQVRLRNTPQLEFVPDDVAEEARRIDDLLRRVREHGELPDDGVGDAAGPASSDVYREA